MKNIYWFFGSILLFLSASSHAQIIDLAFDGSIADQSGNDHELTYIVNGEVTEPGEILYTSGVEDQAVSINNLSGFILPLEVTDQVFASNIWVIDMTFMVTEWGENYGGRMLFNHQKADNNPRWFMDIGKLDDERGDMTFHLHDGDVDISGTVGNFPLNEWINFTVTVDFDERYWTVSSDYFYNSKDFSGDDFSYETMQNDGSGNTLDATNIYVGKNSQKDDFESGLLIDNFKFSTTIEVDIDEYKSNLITLTNHLNGTNTDLTNEEVTALANSVIASHTGSYIEAKTEVDDFLQTYEDTKPPLFESVDKIDFYNETEPIDWVSFVLKIDLFTNYFEPGYFDQVAGWKFEEADVYPGPVSETAPRVTDAVVSIDGSNLSDPGYNLNGEEDGVVRPTGYYAAPGELITVSVDEAYINEGFEIVIGAQVWDLSRWFASLNRFPNISKSFDLNTTQIHAANPFGGLIYVRVPLDADAGIFEITIDNVVKAPFYSSLEHNATSSEEWRTEVEKGDVLWMDWESESMLITIPIHNEHYDTDDGPILVDPEVVMDRYDSMWDIFQVYAGRPLKKSRSEWYQTDRRLPFGALGSGYPMVLSEPYAPEEFCYECPGHNIGNHPYSLFDEVELRNEYNAFNTILHELGHNMDMPTIHGELETIVELNYAMMLTHVEAMPADSAFKYASEAHLTREQAVIDWAISKNFRSNNEMGWDEIGEVEEKGYQHRGWAKFFDLGMLLGWDFLGNGNKVFYDRYVAEGDPEDLTFITGEEFIEAMCTANNLNVTPLIHFWGYHPSEELLTEVNALPRSQEIYEQLIYYRSVIPRTLEEYLPYYNKVADENDYNGRMGTAHFEKYDSALAYFDEFDYAADMLAQIDLILEIYYDSDFDGDGLLFYEDCNDLDPDNAPIMESIEVAECESYIFDEETLTESGEYSAMFQNDAGCDSLVNLSLTILSPDEISMVHEACKSFEFAGENLTESGDYTATFQNMDGCDSLVNLSLTILPEHEVIEEISVEESFDFDGQTLIESGEYTGIFTNQFGCDSTVTIILDVASDVLATDIKYQLSIYPNPTSSSFKIDGLKLESIISISELSGKTLHQEETLTNSVEIDLKIAPGIYLLRIENVEGIKTYKIVFE